MDFLHFFKKEYAWHGQFHAGVSGKADSMDFLDDHDKMHEYLLIWKIGLSGELLFRKTIRVHNKPCISAQISGHVE